MKKTFFLYLFLTFCASSLSAQYIRISYPKSFSVLQRNDSNNAPVTIAGQLLFVSSSVPSGATISYRFNTYSPSGILISYGTFQTTPVSPTGMFYTTVGLSVGWYEVEIQYLGSYMGANRFGVGDVYVIAGQSNAQGVGSPGTWVLPSPSSYPQCIVSCSQDGNCTNSLPVDGYTMMQSIGGFNKIGPTGNNSWCYAALGKMLSDAGGGMPIAFFNASSGGSTVTQWYQGSQGLSAPNGYVSGYQFCDVSGSNPSAYYGQPYTPLKTALNYYASIFGVRAVLWHQGEADSDGGLTSSYRILSPAEYQTKLEAVITKSRTDFGNANLAWIIPNVSLSNGNPVNSNVRTGQTNSVNPSSKRFGGPDTDYDGAVTTEGYRRDGTHFDNQPVYNYGLDFLATKWFNEIGTDGYRIGPGFVPNINYTISLSDIRTLTAPAGYSEYRWGTNINSPIAGATTRTYSTGTPQGIKCFIKDSNGNWHVSPEITVGATPGTRIGATEKEREIDELGVSLSVFPNPAERDFTIEFTVPDDGNNVSLDIIDVNGRTIKTIVNNPHAKGAWKYPVNGFERKGGELYLCRLKVNDLFIIKKIINAGK